MSWQAYVDTNLVGSGKIAKAAILGRSGGVWAASPDFTLSQAEQDAVVKAFDNAAHTQANGIRLMGQKYLTISVGESIIQGKKSADGVVIAKTEQAILVAVYVGPVQAAEVHTVVEPLAGYLKGLGY